MGNARRLEDVKKIMENAEIVISCLGTDGDDTLSTAMAHILSTMEEQHIKSPQYRRPKCLCRPQAKRYAPYDKRRLLFRPGGKWGR
ncbi:hypothetical protein B4070_1006 [Bacillus subtilis]|nr:hypothetical protein B4070_1006 [Bacillus subtilis]